MSPPTLQSALQPTLESALAFLEDDLERVERAMIDGMTSVAPLIPKVGEYTFSSGGKRIRPLLVLLGARLFDYRGERVIRVAAAAEWLHSASLMHDDVVDGASTRRGRPSANAEFGARQAILVGDFLYARLCRELVEVGEREILLRYAEAISDMAEGEVLQLASSFEPDVDEATYLQVIGRKTSSLLATAVQSGAVLAGASRERHERLREYGWQLGLAFQLVDDALDYAGDHVELGKAPLTDLAEGKVTLPLLIALSRCGVSERESIASALKTFGLESKVGRAPDPEALACVLWGVERYGGIEDTVDRAREHSQRAIAELDGFPDGPALHALARLAEFVVERRF